jgi:hypothetical protein
MPTYTLHLVDLLHAVKLRHGTDGFTSPPKEGVLRIFRPKNPTASAGCEPANLGTKDQHATSRPSKPLVYKIVTTRASSTRNATGYLQSSRFIAKDIIYLDVVVSVMALSLLRTLISFRRFEGTYCIRLQGKSGRKWKPVSFTKVGVAEIH